MYWYVTYVRRLCRETSDNLKKKGMTKGKAGQDHKVDVGSKINSTGLQSQITNKVSSKKSQGNAKQNDDIITDYNSEVDDPDIRSLKDAVILPVDVHEAAFRNKNRPDLDAEVFKTRKYEEAIVEMIELQKKKRKNHIYGLNTEQEAVDTIDSENKFIFPLVNTRILTKEATTYELESFNKNALVIFNQREFDGHYETRIGTEKDVDALISTFKYFGFEVTINNDLKKDELFRVLKKFSKRDFTEYGCVAVAILTHSDNDGMLLARDHLYHEIEVIKHFQSASNPTLESKPKIFIIQACGGVKTYSGVPVNIRKATKDTKDLAPYYIQPMESDLLILKSSYPGRPSYRDEVKGSWFIQTLCKKIDKLSSTEDLESIITEVKRDVAINKQYEEYNKITHEMNIAKQMPVITSTLLRKLYLKKFEEPALKKTIRKGNYVDKSRRCSESKYKVLDAYSRSHKTPCCCLLEDFTSMKNCLRYFVAENPYDETAQDLLDVANTYDDSVEFNKVKDKMCKVMSDYLMDIAQDSQIYKSLNFVPVGHKCH